MSRPYQCFGTTPVGGHYRPGAPQDIGGGITLSGEPPFTMNERWRSWLGTLVAEETDRCSLWITAVGASNAAGGAAELAMLKQRLLAFWYGMAFQGVPYYSFTRSYAGYLNSGDNNEIIEAGTLTHLVPLNNGWRPQLDRRYLADAARIGTLLESHRDAGRNRGRYQRTLYALHRGLTATHLEFQHVEFVRTLEGVFQTWGMDGFRDTVGLVFEDGDSVDKMELLEQIYRLRSKIQHMEPISKAFPGLSDEQAKMKAEPLVGAARVLASDVVCAVLEHPDLVAMMSKEDSLEMYWKSVQKGRVEPPFKLRLREEVWRYGSAGQ